MKTFLTVTIWLIWLFAFFFVFEKVYKFFGSAWYVPPTMVVILVALSGLALILTWLVNEKL